MPDDSESYLAKLNASVLKRHSGTETNLFSPALLQPSSNKQPTPSRTPPLPASQSADRIASSNNNSRAERKADVNAKPTSSSQQVPDHRAEIREAEERQLRRQQREQARAAKRASARAGGDGGGGGGVSVDAVPQPQPLLQPTPTPSTSSSSTTATATATAAASSSSSSTAGAPPRKKKKRRKVLKKGKKDGGGAPMSPVMELGTDAQQQQHVQAAAGDGGDSLTIDNERGGTEEDEGGYDGDGHHRGGNRDRNNNGGNNGGRNDNEDDDDDDDLGGSFELELRNDGLDHAHVTPSPPDSDRKSPEVSHSEGDNRARRSAGARRRSQQQRERDRERREADDHPQSARGEHETADDLWTLRHNGSNKPRRTDDGKDHGHMEPGQIRRKKTAESVQPVTEPPKFQQISPADLAASPTHVDGQVLEVKAPVIPWWDSQDHVDLIHRAGLKAPPMVIEYCPVNEHRPRYYFQLFIPQTSVQQDESVLFCRRKQKTNKFRFSMDPNNMRKRNNPQYVGKMKYVPAKHQFLVTLKNDVTIASISLHSELGKHDVGVDLLNQYLNYHETGKAGRSLTGKVQTYMQPLISLKVKSTNRPVLVVHKPQDVKQVAGPEPNAKYLIEMDYPLTIFLSFSIVCAVETYRRNLLLPTK